METKTPIKFKDSKAVTPMEPDREELKSGISLIITDAFISTQTKYDRVSKINGLVNGVPKKFYTTSKIIADHVQALLDNYGSPDGHLSQPIEVLVVTKRSGNNRDYLTFE